jgi:hypothetical protein
VNIKKKKNLNSSFTFNTHDGLDASVIGQSYALKDKDFNKFKDL